MKVLSYYVHASSVLLVAVEFFLAAAAVYLAAWLCFGASPAAQELTGPIFPKAVMFATVVVTGLTAMGLYRARQRLTTEGVLVRVAIALALAAVGLMLVYFAVPILAQGRGWLAVTLGLTALLVAADRAVFLHLVSEELFRRRVLVYGAGDGAASVLQLRRRGDQRGFRITAFLPAPGDRRRLNDERVENLDGPLLDRAQQLNVDEIVVAMDDRRQGFPVPELLACKFAGIDVVDLLTFLERESGRVTIDLLNPSWMIFSEGFTRRCYRRTVTRIFDLAASISLLAVTWPCMLIAAIAILGEDGGPVFYRQTRVGLLGTHFKLLKLRSMRQDAESAGIVQWGTSHDGRVTRVGRIIRQLRIDELPQLINIIMNDMSFVGPRPERPELVEKLVEHNPYYHERHCVKPGLTGWAQLSYSYGVSEQDAIQKLQYDLYYVKNQSLIFNLMIMLQTVEVVLLQKGLR